MAYHPVHQRMPRGDSPLNPVLKSHLESTCHLLNKLDGTFGSPIRLALSCVAMFWDRDLSGWFVRRCRLLNMLLNIFKEILNLRIINLFGVSNVARDGPTIAA